MVWAAARHADHRESRLHGLMVNRKKEETRVSKSQNVTLDKAAALLSAFGGEQIAGSGFEAEEPESGFTTNEISDDERPVDSH